MEDIKTKIKRNLIGKIETNVEEAFSMLRETSNPERFDSEGRLRKNEDFEIF